MRNVPKKHAAFLNEGQEGATGRAVMSATTVRVSSCINSVVFRHCTRVPTSQREAKKDTPIR